MLWLGMGPRKLASDQGLKIAAAETLMTRWKATYPAAIRYFEEVKVHVKSDGFIKTITGRKRYYQALKVAGQAGKEKMAEIERQARNNIAQGKFF